MARFFGIGVVWIGCGLAWIILGSTLVARSGESSASLLPEVQALWGPEGVQGQPVATYFEMRERVERRTVAQANGQGVQTIEEHHTDQVDLPVPLSASDLNVAMDLEHRRRGLVWFATFGVAFDGRYTFVNPTDQPREVTVRFPLAEASAVYDGFEVVGPEGPVGYEIGAGSAHWTESYRPGESRTYHIRYHTRATDRWTYGLSSGTSQVNDFRLRMTTNFAEVDFPDGSVSPTRHARSANGWEGEWRFDSLVTNRSIGVVPPQRLNPGPLASRITFFAPVGLLFFFFAVAILARSREQDLHPMHYFFLGCAFFAFHLLFAYLIDHLEILPSFAIATVVSTFLVISYARLFVGWRFAVREIGISQLLYLVLFSCTFLWEGFTGLAITVGAIVTLFVMMQLTGRIRWGASVPKPGTPAPTPEATSVPTVF